MLASSRVVPIAWLSTALIAVAGLDACSKGVGEPDLGASGRSAAGSVATGGSAGPRTPVREGTALARLAARPVD